MQRGLILPKIFLPVMVLSIVALVYENMDPSRAHWIPVTLAVYVGISAAAFAVDARTRSLFRKVDNERVKAMFEKTYAAVSPIPVLVCRAQRGLPTYLVTFASLDAMNQVSELNRSFRVAVAAHLRAQGYRESARSGGTLDYAVTFQHHGTKA